MGMKSVAPSSAHLALRAALEQTVQQHIGELPAAELLAVLSHLVGQVIALQDQRTMTPSMVMQLVQSNIERGNFEVVDGLLGATGGRA